MMALLGVIIFHVLVAGVIAYCAAWVIIEALDRVGLVYDPSREDASHPAPFPAELLEHGETSRRRQVVAVGPGRPRVQNVSGRR